LARTLTELDEWPRQQAIDTFDTVYTAEAGLGLLVCVVGGLCPGITEEGWR